MPPLLRSFYLLIAISLIFTGSALAANDLLHRPVIAPPSPITYQHLPSSISFPSSLPSLFTVYHLPSTDGAKLYEFWCSTCHGDRGQGLTAEWRAQWPEGKQNCWQAKCHSTSHPPDGFTFPKNVPALIGPNALAKFSTAQDLYAYARAAMPYWSPNLLSDDEYRAITIFLVKANYAARDWPVPAELSQDLKAISLSSQSQQKTEIPAKAEETSSLTSASPSRPNSQPLIPAPASAASGYMPLLWIPLIALGGLFVIFLAVRISSRSH